MPKPLRQMGVIERIASGFWSLLKCEVGSNEKPSRAHIDMSRYMKGPGARVATAALVLGVLTAATPPAAGAQIARIAPQEAFDREKGDIAIPASGPGQTP